MKKILVVGAGFAGAVVARELAESGYFVDIIDSREHIAGNCYDPIDENYHTRIHQYGPHIFHTNDSSIVEYLSRFSDWIEYKHQVQAYVEGIGYVPFPINITTINRLYDLKLTKAKQMKEFLSKVCSHHSKPDNARSAAENIFGKELVELFFARYTHKMWAMDLDELPSSVFARLPVRYDTNANYFNNKFQLMPKSGYIHLFENMLNHNNIHISLETEFDKQMEKNYQHCFNSMSIDQYFDYEFGQLPYRSIKFYQQLKTSHKQPVPTVNLTDISPVTRFTDWKMYPGCGFKDSQTIVSYETPCAASDNNNARFYPVKTVSGEPQQRYNLYTKLAEKYKNNITFIGRCGQYRYLDMHQVVANSLMLSKNFLDNYN